MASLRARHSKPPRPAPPRSSSSGKVGPSEWPDIAAAGWLGVGLYLMGLAIAASTSPSIDARLFWILATIVVGAYILSRGIAKAATRSRAYDPHEDIGKD
jgi:hypothetical protein